MDLIKQNKFIGWVIAILVVLNLLSLSMFWMQRSKNPPPPSSDQGNPEAGSLPLLQRELGLSADQTQKFEELRRAYQESAKPINDELDAEKLSLADEIFKPAVDQRKVDSVAAHIGILQSKMEMLRFNHFAQLAQICDVAQREKLYPILREVFGKKGPAAKGSMKPEQTRPRDARDVEPGEQEAKPRQQGERPGPPTQEEKLSRYAERLKLTSEQVTKVRDILAGTRTKEEAFKEKSRPSEAEFELAKQRIRDDEDRSIMKLLNAEQKKQFERMLENRRQQPHR